MSNPNASAALSSASEALINKVQDRESGGRKPRGLTAHIIFGVSLAWSLFQLWVASPLPYEIGFGVFNDTAVRAIHLAFGLFLAYMLYTLREHSVRDRVPLYDWILATAAVLCALYVYLFESQLITRPGAPSQVDIGVACVGVLLLLEATRRCLGWPMTIIGIIFLGFVFCGPWMPELLAHKGASLSRAASHFWITTEGVFGVALGVSAGFVFLYVLFGAMLDRAGAGDYLTGVAFALLGNFRGGPAKAAILSSGLNGMVSGSSVVLTGGNVTISLMKRVGYSPVKAGAIEVASSSNGQLMPPVMGAAAFLMVEYINMPYTEIIKHALMPALLAYASLLYIAHLEALKAGMVGLPKAPSPLRAKLFGWGIAAASLVILINAALWLSEGLPRLFGEAANLVAGGLVVGGYVGLMYLSSRFPHRSFDDPNALKVLPPVGPTVLSGLHFLLPLFLLVWCLTVLEQSPGLAAFYACLLMAVMLLTQKPLMNWFRGVEIGGAWRGGWNNLLGSLADGARNMVGIAIATAAAGVVVGAVSLTGVGQVLAEVVEVVAGNSIFGILLLTAFLCLVLGMGLPTTANYIVVSTLLAPVIVSLAASNGLDVPLIAVHLFVFYFGIMADATPPVALAAYAAAGLSGADPLKTGIQGFIYEMRTAVLPFVWIFNPELLLIGNDVWAIMVTVVCAAVACVSFASATQGFMVVKNYFWESLGLLVVTFFLMWPQSVRSLFVDQWALMPANQVETLLGQAESGTSLRLRVAVKDHDSGQVAEKTYLLPVREGDVTTRLSKMGISIDKRGEEAVYIGYVEPGGAAEKVLLSDLDENRVLGVEVANVNVPNKAWFTLPAFGLLGLIVLMQMARRRRI
jgi:TRAP transporter 4TM/12TM fusion protein